MFELGNLNARARQSLSWLRSHTGVVAILLALAVIVLGVGLGYYSNKTIPINPDPVARYVEEPSNPLSYMSNWDGPIYLLIAQKGYNNDHSNQFFPAYPGLVHGLTYVTRSPVLAALIVSWTCFVGAVYLYARLLKLMWPRVTNTEIISGLLLFAFFPTGVFWLASYPMALFTFVVLGAMVAALRKQPYLAGAWMFVATLCHPDGIFLLTLVTLMLARANLPMRKIIASLAIGASGILAYMAYLWVCFDNPLQFTEGHKHNGWLQFGSYLHNLVSSVTVFSLLTFILLITTAFYWWSRRREFSIFTVLYLILPLAGGIFGGYGRYALVIIPAHLMLFTTTRGKRLAYPMTLLFFGILWTFFVIHYAAGYTGGG